MAPQNHEVIMPPTDQFGFCEGVVAADDLLTMVSEAALAAHMPVYGFHEIVHNREVAAKHEANGVSFINEIDAIPDGSIVVTSAHGVSPEVVHALQQKGCEHFDAACPLVIVTHRGIQAARAHNEKVIYVGHGKPGESEKLHDEIVGALGHMDYRIDEDGELVEDPVERIFVELGEDLDRATNLLSETGKYRIITQTTLHDGDCLDYQQQIADYIYDLQPTAAIAKVNRSNVCSAVRQRQDGVDVLLKNPTRKPDRVVVVTDPNSSNGMGYYKQAAAIIGQTGLDAAVFHIATIDEAKDIPKDGLTAITASASTPDTTTKAVAVAFGAKEEDLDWQRKSFELRDADPAKIAKRIASLALEQAS